MIAALISLPAGLSSLAAEVAPSNPPVNAPCAVLEKFGGQIGLLDPTRSHLIDATVKSGVACGGWVSADHGWAQLFHRDGYTIHVGKGSFLEILDGHDSTRSLESDQIVVYRGIVFVEKSEESGELRILSPNARARLTGNSGAVLIYRPDEQETQVISLEGTNTIENRFETSRPVDVKAGEASSLNFKILRVLPSTPRVVTVASLKPVLMDLHLTESEENHAVASVLHRQDRRFASVVGANGKAEDGNYLRHPNDESNSELQVNFVKNIVGGEEDGEKILNPHEFHGRAQKVDVLVEDPAAQYNVRQRKRAQAAEDVEKKRLMEELTKIRLDE